MKRREFLVGAARVTGAAWFASHGLAQAMAALPPLSGKLAASDTVKLGNTGIQTDSAGNVTCYYWLHVHPANKNVIHIESPANDTFTLGQFFDVSNAWSQANGFGAQKLDATHVATFTLQPGDKIVAYVDLGDGKGPQPFTGDPRSIVLRSHEVITIEISPPDVNPPPAFDWKSAANSGL